jgi:Amt family ammonium transporter
LTSGSFGATKTKTSDIGKSLMTRRHTLSAVLALATYAPTALSQGADSTPAFDGLGTLWVLLAAFLVFFMQAGFSMVEAGFVRAKNAGNVLMKNLVDFCFASLGFFLFGYALMYGGDGALFGTSGWLLMGVESPVEGLPLHAFWLFQAVFVGAAATIVAGGLAERMKFGAYLAYSFIISALVYPIVGHWVWGGGWLSELGFHDFAGSTVVHAVGGFTALVGIWMVGPRIGKYNADGSPNVIGTHNMPLAGLGVFILWVGWFGFNAGSTLGFDDPAQVALIAVNTNLAAVSGAIVAMAFAWIKYGKPDVAHSSNGVLAGLVSITAPFAVVSPIAAIVIGAVGGVVVIYSASYLERIRLDDPVGAVAVHGFCGVWGTLAVGLAGQAALGAPADGLFLGGGCTQLEIQALGIIACLGFVVVVMGGVFKLIDVTVGLRVSEEAELRGLDVHEHGSESYSGFQIFLTE